MKARAVKAEIEQYIAECPICGKALHHQSPEHLRWNMEQHVMSHKLEKARARLTAIAEAVAEAMMEMAKEGGNGHN